MKNHPNDKPIFRTDLASEEDVAAFHRDGYVIFPEVFTDAGLEGLIDEILVVDQISEFLGLSDEDSTTGGEAEMQRLSSLTVLLAISLISSRLTTGIHSRSPRLLDNVVFPEPGRAVTMMHLGLLLTLLPPQPFLWSLPAGWLRSDAGTAG